MWRKNQFLDHNYKKAKLEGYRARSAYKLLEIQEKFKLIKASDHVIDLGCAPGSWLQVLTSITKNKIYGIDLQKIDPIPGVEFLQGDFLDNALVMEFLKTAPARFDVILSDIAHSKTGDRFIDSYRSLELIEAVFNFANLRLKKGGKVLCKAFDSACVMDYIKSLSFKIKLYKPKATKSESSEFFILAKID